MSCHFTNLFFLYVLCYNVLNHLANIVTVVVVTTVTIITVLEGEMGRVIKHPPPVENGFPSIILQIPSTSF